MACVFLLTSMGNKSFKLSVLVWGSLIRDLGLDSRIFLVKYFGFKIIESEL
jgi:hypothetical protein